MISRRKFLSFAVSSVGAAAFARPSHAETWPARPIKVVVPLPPGGGSDYLARIVGDKLVARLGQPLVIENRVGADGRIGIEHAARQPADGYTLLFITNTQVVHPALFARMNYDIIKDFDPVSQVANLGIVLVVHPGVPATTVKEYVELARARPGEVTFASSGYGSPFQLGGELMKSMAGVNMLHVPYKGSNQVLMALLAGEVMSAFAPMHGAFLPAIQAGKLRPLGMVTAKRSHLLPDIPTIAEAGPLPGYALESWFGVVAPAGTPKSVIERLSSGIAAVVKDPEFAKARLWREGFEPVGSTPAELAAFMKAGIAKYGRIVREAKISVQ